MAKFKTATKPLLRTYDALLSKREEAFQAVFAAAAPRRDIPWQTCFSDYADDSVRRSYRDADSAILAFQMDMSSQRRGYFENGRFSWY